MYSYELINSFSNIFRGNSESYGQFIPQDENEKTEIFPKQGMLTKSMSQSWINLPYFGGDEHRFLYDREKNNYTLIEAMEIIEESRVTEEQINFFIKNLPLEDAPLVCNRYYKS